MQKKNLLIICGGQSSEHEISLISASNIISLIDRKKWELYIVGITKDGRWLLVENEENLTDESLMKSSEEAFLSPDAGVGGLVIGNEATGYRNQRIDVCFPVLHGKNGEDGSVQGLLTLSGIPYVGCGILASAAGMDKFYTKIIVDSIGVRQAAFVGARRGEIEDEEKLFLLIKHIEEKLSYPVFLKPSRAGSSVGVTKAHDRDELIKGLKKAAEIDSKILIEEFIKGRETECAVLKESESSETLCSGVGEILAGAEFYDYDAKYLNAGSETVLDPVLPEGAADTIRSYAGRIFDALDGFGLSRVDFFVTDSGEVVFNEINTIPGFTPISMYPMLFERAGIKKEELIEKLLRSAFCRGDLR